MPSFSFYPEMIPSSNFDALLSMADQPYLEMTSELVTEHSAATIPWVHIVFGGYFLGSLLFFARFIYGLRKIYRIYSNGDKIKNENHLLVKGKNTAHAFSFFNILFIGNEYEHGAYQQIINHELGHVKGRHSIDIIFVELLNILFWFSPFIYWYKKAIRITHEYIADHQVISNGNKTDYGRLLISHAHSNTFADFANFIFRSPLKTRIQMMYSKRTGKTGILKYFSILPLTLFILLFFSNTSIKAELNQLDQQFEIIAATSDTIPPAPPVPPSPPPAPKKIVKAPKAPVAPVPPKAINDVPPPPPPPKSFNGDETFIVVEEMPRFPGCEAIGDRKERTDCANRRMLEYIYKNLSYPKEARESGIQGKVVVEFLVKKDGSIDKIAVLRDIGGNCGQAVMNVIESMNSMEEKWIPGKQRGKYVNLKYTLPVSFKTENGEGKSKSLNPMKSKSGVDAPSPSKEEIKLAINTQIEPQKSSDVIFVLDGKVVKEGEADINPEDIERIDGVKTPEIINKFVKGNERGVVFIYSKKESQKKEVFVVVEEMPMFPGCEDVKEDQKKCSHGKLVAFISANLKYPKDAEKAGVEGKVVVQFIVNETGDIQDIQITRSLGYGCDEEVLRVMNVMKTMDPKWIPGKQRGKTVSVQLKLPFSFKLPPKKD
jgi:TonB family protein